MDQEGMEKKAQITKARFMKAWIREATESGE